MGGRELWNEKVPAQVSMGTKITHADYCMCAYVSCMSLCTSMCQIKFPYPLLLPFGTASHQHQTGWALYCSVNDTGLASLALHIEALYRRTDVINVAVYIKYKKYSSGN